MRFSAILYPLSRFSSKQVFDFELSPEDMTQLDELDHGEEGRFIDLKFLLGWVLSYKLCLFSFSFVKR